MLNKDKIALPLVAAAIQTPDFELTQENAKALVDFYDAVMVALEDRKTKPKREVHIGSMGDGIKSNRSK